MNHTHFIIPENIVIRNIKVTDIDAICRLSETGLPGMDPFTPSQIESQLQIFPEGQFCIDYDGEIIGSCSSMILNFSDYTGKENYDEITSEGRITNHDPNGVNLYGTDIVIHPDYRGQQLGSRLYQVRKRLCIQLNLQSIIFGGRIPGYYKYANDMSVEKYVRKVLKKRIYDPTLTFQLNKGFDFKGIIPNYLPDDKDSLKYAILLEWKNPYYQANANIDMELPRYYQQI